MEDINFDDIEKDMSIDNSSMFRLEETLMECSKKEAQYHRMWSNAVKKMDGLSLRLETLVATIMDEQIRKAETNGKPIPPSSLDSVRKIRVPLDKRYIALKKGWIEAKDTASTLEGFAKAWKGRGFRLGELVKVAKLTHGPQYVGREEAELNEVGKKLI